MITAYERLDRDSIPEPNSGCLLWLGGVATHGYGQFAVNGRSRLAHRLAYERAHGPIPDGNVVMHKCDVKLCINPAHLMTGTMADNNLDKKVKGRGAFGTRHGHAKLTEDQVRAIRIDSRSQSKIGADYGIHQHQVSLIKRRLNWGHV